MMKTENEIVLIFKHEILLNKFSSHNRVYFCFSIFNLQLQIIKNLHISILSNLLHVNKEVSNLLKKCSHIFTVLHLVIV